VKPLRAAVIGVGRIGSLHADAYYRNPYTELVAVMDADQGRAQEVGARYGVNAYTSVDELLQKETFDIVSIAVPEGQRSPLAAACAQAGKHLLLEKPLTPSLEETDRLIAAVEAAGVTAMVNFILRFDPRYIRAKEAVADGTIGEPGTVFARRRGTAAGADVLGSWTDLLISTAIHDLDMMAWINGPAVRVYAEGFKKKDNRWGHEDGVMAVLRFANGCIGTLETSWILPSTVPAGLDASFHLVGTKGGVFIDGSNHGLSVVDQERYTEPDLTHWPVGPAGVFGDLRNSIDHFIDAVRTGQKPRVTLQDARYAEELVAAVKQSMRTGQPVALPLSQG